MVQISKNIMIGQMSKKDEIGLELHFCKAYMKTI